jgi:hypothetical protein
VGCKRHKNKSCSRAPTNHKKHINCKKHIWKREGWETWKSNEPTRALFLFRLMQCNPPRACSGLSIIPVIQIVILLLVDRLFALDCNLKRDILLLFFDLCNSHTFFHWCNHCMQIQSTDSCHLASPTCYAHAPPVFTWLPTPCYHWLR